MRLFTTVLLTVLLFACSKPSPNTIKVGTVAGPESELLEVAQKVAREKHGLNIKIIEFTDYNLLNEALQDGALDANVFQHLPYLKAASQAHGYRLKVMGQTFIYPTAIYSKRFKAIDALPNHALIALPNDPSNEARALLLLQKSGLITLKETQNASIQDIKSNPKQLRFKELDAAQLPRVLEDVDAAVINTNFAISSGLNPMRDALFLEDKNSPYANLIVVREERATDEKLGWLVEALHSAEVQEKARTLFGGAAIPAW